METAAFLARPMPVRQAESVSTPESVTAETDISRMSVTSVFVSSAPSEGYNIDTIGFASANSPIAQDIDSAKVSASENMALFLPPSSSPRENFAETAGTVAAANP